MRHPLPIFLLLLPGTLLSCGGSSEEEVPGVSPVLRLSLQAEVQEELSPLPKVVREWAGAELLELTAERGRTSLEEGLLEVDTKVRRLDLLDLPALPFDRIAVEVASLGGGLEVLLLDGSGQVIVSAGGPDNLPKRAARPTKFYFDVPAAAGAVGRIARLRLQPIRCPAPIKIQSLSLLRSDPETWLPSAEKPDHVSLEPRQDHFDGRFACGLSTRVVLTTNVPAEARSGRLAFSVGIPEELRTQAQDVELLLTVADPGSAQVWQDRYPIPVGEWSDVAHVLPEGALGSELLLRFELTATSETIVTAALSVPILERVEAQPPTVLLITSDTHRADHMGLAPERLAKTPFLDELASRGYLFDDCQSDGNNTNPTHLSVMTGVSVRDHGVIGNDSSIGPEIQTLTKCFASQGYHTYAAVSTQHLTWSGCEQGFDRLCGPETMQQDSEVTLDVLESWLASSEGRPLFIWLHSFDPHGPYLPPKPYDTLYEEAPLEGQGDLELPRWARHLAGAHEVIARYKGEVTYWDAQLRQLFESWPRLEAGVVALVGDHGEHMVHPLEDKSFSHYGLSKDTLHVPMFITWPDAPPAVRVARPVNQRDLGRTLLDVAGLTHVTFPGESLLYQADLEPDPDLPRYAIGANALFASVRHGKWMLVQGLYGSERIDNARQPDHSIGLYDTDKDPGCTVDLAAQHQQRTLEMRRELVGWLQASRIGEWSIGETRKDAATLRHLAALGYSASTALPDENPWMDPACACEVCTRYPLVGRVNLGK